MRNRLLRHTNNYFLKNKMTKDELKRAINQSNFPVEFQRELNHELKVRTAINYPFTNCENKLTARALKLIELINQD